MCLHCLCPNYQEYIQSVRNLFQPVENFAKNIADKYNYLERKAEEWTNAHLPQPFASIVQKALSSLPVSLAFFFIPMPFSAIALAGYIIIQIVKPDFLSPQSKIMINNGVGFGAAIEAVRDTALFVMTGNPLLAISAVVSGVSSWYFFNAAQKVAQQMQQPI